MVSNTVTTKLGFVEIVIKKCVDKLLYNNSTKVNGVNTIETPMDGVNIGVIKGAEVKTVEFSVRIDKK